MQQSINVTFFHIDSDKPGGGTKMLFRLLKSIDKNKFTIRLVVQERGFLYENAQELDIQTEVVPFSGILDTYNRNLLSTSISGKIRTAARILQYNIDTRPIIAESDIIWCENLRMVLTLLPTIQMRSIPVIWNIGLGIPSEGKIKYLNDIALRSVSDVYIESDRQTQRVFTEEQYESFSHKFTTFHKGIDIKKFEPDQYDSIDEEGYKIGTAASLTPRKGLDYLIDAMLLILEEYDSVTLSIAGRPPDGNIEYANRLKQQVQDYGIEDHVEFLGWVENMPEYLSTLDVFVLPSLNEGIPGVVREASAMKNPVVATNVGGTSDAVIDGETGYLIEPGDADQIAKYVIKLLNDPQKQFKMGKRGRGHIAGNFTIEHYVDQYEKFITNIAL